MAPADTARAYYTAMRTEINQHLQIVNQTQTLYLGAVTALFAGALGEHGNKNLLLLVPFLGLGAATIINSHERIIGCIAAYCARELGEFLEAHSEEAPQWDDSEVLTRLLDQHFGSNLFSSLYLIVLPGLAALLTFQSSQATEKIWFYVWELGWLAVACSVFGVFYTRRHRRSQKKWSSRKLP
jgi:hypothetical protein